MSLPDGFFRLLELVHFSDFCYHRKQFVVFV